MVSLNEARFRLVVALALIGDIDQMEVDESFLGIDCSCWIDGVEVWNAVFGSVDANMIDERTCIRFLNFNLISPSLYLYVSS